jgi:type I restriction enzyme S subunit
LKVSKLFPCNTLFFTIAANIGDIGFASFATACPDSLIAITPNNHVDKQWLFHELKSRKAIFESLATQNAQLNINLEKLRPYTLPLPPLPEQRAIATALSDVDALLAAQDKLIAKKRDLKQAAMQQLLTGKQRLRKTGENGEWIVDNAGNPVFFSGEWEVKRLEQIAHIKTGSRNNEDKIDTGEYPFFVRSENVERINSYSHDCEAILVPGEGRIGDIFHYINGRFDVHQRVYAITQFNLNVSAQFVHRYMTMHFGVWAMQNTVKATVDSLRLPTFQTFVMRLPPTKEEQTAIAAVLSDMDTELAALAQQRDKTRALKQGMMQELLTGRIRLVEPRRGGPACPP